MKALARRTRSDESGITLLGSMLILTVLALGVALLTRQNTLGTRLKVAVENRMLASVAADSILGVLATMDQTVLCTALQGTNSNTHSFSKSETGFEWLNNWETPGRIGNIRLKFQALQTILGTTPNSPNRYVFKTYPATCVQPFNNVHQKVQVFVDYTRSAGDSWQTLEVEKWIPAP